MLVTGPSGQIHRVVALGWLLLFQAAVATGAPAETELQAGGWGRPQERQGVILYERQAPAAAGLREALAWTEVAQPPERVLRVLQDYSSFPEWAPYSAETRLVARDGAQDHVFQRMDLPWPVGNRYYTLRFDLEGPDASGGYRLSWDLAAPERQVACHACGVATPLNRGVWQLLPLDGGTRTELRCQALSDPGGRLPGFAVRAANRRLFPRLLAAVRERASLERYARNEAPR
jgi:hypothetical protein